MRPETELNIALTEFFRPIVAQCVQEALQKFTSNVFVSPSTNNVDPYGDFKWLTATCPGVPSSTLRIKSASGEIPGVVKFGKRVLYEKVVVLAWLRSQTRGAVDSALIDQDAEAQFNRQLNKKGGERV